MLRNYLKIALRNLLRNKVFSGINILGLALGMASSLIIFLWIQDEVSIGKQYDNSENLYRLMRREYTEGKVDADRDMPGLMADELKKVYPEVTHAAGFSWPEGHVLSVGDKILRQTGRYVGADWFELYDIELLAGSRATAPVAPHDIAISRKVAETYFDSPESALGKSIHFGYGADYQVTAVFEDLPADALEGYDFLMSWARFLERNEWSKDWSNSGPDARIALRPDTDVAQFEAKIKNFLMERNAHDPKYHAEVFLQPEEKAYLYSDFKNGYPDGGRIEYVRLLGIVAVFLLLIAGINFMNLATARSVKRAREVGVRKVVGAERSSLIGQFMGEAMLLTTLALIVALVLVLVLLPVFNSLTGKQLSLPLGQPQSWGILLALLLGMAALAGSYPALFLSSLDPLRILKGSNLRFSAGALVFRRGLVVFQFAMSMLLIVGTVVIYQQMQYIQTKNLGFDRENVIRVDGGGDLAMKYPTFKQELLRLPSVQAVTHTWLHPSGNGNTTESVSWPGKDPAANISFNNTAVGYDFAKVWKVNILQGRDFSPDFGADSTNYLINQAAARRMGFENPVGQSLTFGDQTGTIVGLVEDFHFNSLHEVIRPMIIRLKEEQGWGNIMIRTQPGQPKTALTDIAALAKKIDPKLPFSYSFVDEEFDKLYRGESIVATLTTLFAGMAIFIACLGLFGLAAFTAEQRTKEIGVRKVLGASVVSIVRLLSQDFLKLVLFAIVIASPLAWYVMGEWLQNFEYKVAIGWWVFALAGVLAVGIALLTVSFQSVRAALANPVESLRSE